MDSETCVVTHNRRMFQNDAVLFLLVSYSLKHTYVMYNGQIGLNNLNDTIRTLRKTNIKN
jgi:hypothetical protein